MALRIPFGRAPLSKTTRGRLLTYVASREVFFTTSHQKPRLPFQVSALPSLPGRVFSKAMMVVFGGAGGAVCERL